MSYSFIHFRVSRLPFNAVYSRRVIIPAPKGRSYPVLVYRTLRFNYFFYRGVIICCLRGCYSYSILGNMFYAALNV